MEGGRLPQAAGVRPQLLVTVDLDSLLGHPGGLGGDLGWVGPLDPAACRRLACDGTVTRVLVSRHPNPTSPHHPGHSARGAYGPDGDNDPGVDQSPGAGELPVARDANLPPPHPTAAVADPDGPMGLQQQLRAAAATLPPTLGGGPCQPLEVGRATRVVQPAQRAALAVRDRGCVFPGCDRPLAWCDAHHLWHWVDGGPTNLANLALLCRAHHRQVHEGGWQLIRGPDGRFTARPPDPGSRRSHRHQPDPGVP